MKNPALKIWLEGQVVYGVLHGIAVMFMFFFGIATGVVDLALAGVYGVIIIFVVEFVFALPAIPLLVLWLNLIRSFEFDKSTSILWATAGYMLFMYVCARLLWYLFTDSWTIPSGDAGVFYFFAGLAMLSALIGMIINKRRVYEFIQPTDYVNTANDTNHIQITPQTDTHES
ncbi:MAG: hypothetical protein EOP56_12560 [Sphingobacteriales bacterium]|nr:MAG: hypothetical protein EOP56_12560 [Sphingobacteriales bacterium]